MGRLKMIELLQNLEFKVHTPSLEKSTTKDGRRLIKGYASTSSLDRQSEIISRQALEGAAKDLMTNSTVFLEHQHASLPVAKILSSTLDDKGILIVAEMSKATFCNDVWTLIEEGILNSFSIGGIVLDGHDERGEDGKSYHVIDKICLLEVSIVGLPANPDCKFSPIYKSFNSAIAEQIKQKEESQVAKQDKQEVVKSEAPIEPIVEQPKEVAKDVALEVKQEEAPKAPEVALEAAIEVKKEEAVEVAKEVIEAPKQAEVSLVAKAVEKPIEEKKEEVVEAPKVSEEVIEKAKVDETPSDENPKPDLKAEDSDVEKAEWTTEYINTLPNSSFAVIEPAYLEGKTEDKNCRHLPFKNENGEVDLPHYRNALARVNQIKPITDSISEADLRSQAAAELEKYRDLLEENKSEKSNEEKILDALALIIEKLSSLDKKEVTEKKDEVVEPKKEEKALEVVVVVEEPKKEETVIEKKEVVEVEKVVEKKEETPTRKSLAIVVPSPYEEETKETSPKEEERTKNVGWSKLIFGK
jgi:HK97 family phage prohead protease